MNTIEITAEDVPLPAPEDRIVAFVNAVLLRLNRTQHELSILFCTDDRIRKVNLAFRGKDEATDVLSFAQDEDGDAQDTHAQEDDAASAANVAAVSKREDMQPESLHLLGDIVLALPYLRRQAEEYKVSFESELKRMLVHGMLHLVGVHHNTEEQHRTMLDRQEALLQELEQEYRF
ncbi:MAG: rRNA maturation RNase YbeY [Spirochaeta sp.]|nr:rRNA maturation RNase YbeY [Spirochaeta sp.]